MVVLDFLQLLVAWRCLLLSQAYSICKGKPSPAPSPPISSQFTSGQYSSLSTDSGEILVQLGSLEECAQFCLQITEVGILNCTGLRHEAQGECLISSSKWCKEENSSNISSINHVLKVYNLSYCENTTTSISPSTSIQVAMSSTIKALPTIQDMSAHKYVLINFTVVLLDEVWEETLLYSNSSAYSNLSSSIIHNISQVFINDSIVSDIKIHQYSNHTSRVQAKLSIYFHNNSSMAGFRALYTALHRKQSLNHIRVGSVWDNLPGKPPTNVTISHSANGSAVLSWEHAYNNVQIETLGYRISYFHNNDSDAMVTAYTTKRLMLNGLKPSTNYSITIMSVTSIGFGVKSLPLTTTTLRTVPVPLGVTFTVVLITEQWSAHLLNRTHPVFISLLTKLNTNILLLYNNQSNLGEIKDLAFTQHNVTDGNGSSLVQATIGIKYFGAEALVPVYTALYRQSRLNNIAISLIQDNIPGKPATNITWTSTSPHSIMVSWSSSPSPLCGYIIFYRQNISMNIYNVTANSTSTNTTLVKLLPLSHYVIWIQPITANGLGISSDAISAITSEKIAQVDVKVLLMSETSIDNQFLEVYVEQNVTKLFLNESQFKTASCVIRNDSDDVIAEINLQFGQDVRMRHFSILYNAVYVTGYLGSIAVMPLSDSIPGKPPKDLSATPRGTAAVCVFWSTYLVSDHSTHWIIYHNLMDSNNITIQNSSLLAEKAANQTTITGLQAFSYYQIWIRSVTEWGYGIPSPSVFVRTEEEVLPVNLTMVLPTVPWNIDLLNSSSAHHDNVSIIVKDNVKNFHSNDTKLKTVEVINYSKNDQDNTQVDITLIYGQLVKSVEINRLHTAIYKARKLDELIVEPVVDTIPGKPPSNVLATANSTTSVLLSWDPVPLTHGQKTLNIRVDYGLTASFVNLSILIVQPNITSILVRNLKKFRNYTFQVASVTRIGVGIPSVPVYVRTLEEFVPVQITASFPSFEWSTNLSYPNSEAYRNLCYVIKENVRQLYELTDRNQFRNVWCNQFRNGSVIADLTVVYGQHVNMSDFATLYNALYVDGKLYNISVQPISTDVPGKPPANVTARTLTSASIYVSWSCIDCEATNNTHAFLITYKSRDKNTTQGITVNSTMRHVVLSGLKKFTSYEMLVASVTVRGAGISSKPVYNTTLQDVPSEAPSFLHSYNTSSTSLFVRWGQVPNGSIHGILQGYFIQFKILKDSGNWTIVTAAANASSANVTSLDKFTDYIIKVEAFTVIGSGPARNVTVSTDEDVPSRPPSDIQARNLSSTAIEVTWSQVPSGFKHGIVSGYDILYRRANDSNTTYMMITTHASANLSVRITELNIYTEYRIKIAAFTRKGNGTESKEISVYTDEDTPSLPPAKFLAYNTSSTSINVTWDPILPTYFVHGILRGYRVLYKENKDVNGSYSNMTTLGNHYELGKLNKFTKYSVKVLAFTAKGDGVNSLPLVVSTDEDVPSRPPINLTGHNTSSTSLYLAWDPIPRGFVNGILLGYKVLYKKINHESWNYTNSLITNTTRVAVLLQLRKFTTYKITVLGFTSKGDGPAADNMTITTDEDIPSLPPKNLTGQNTSSTSLRIVWGPVPSGHVHGILRGYRVLFKIAKDVNGSFDNVTSSDESARIEGLEKFTVYVVKVLAYTIKGDGPTTRNISISTDEDVPSLPPTDVKSHNTSATSLNVTWSDIPSGFVHGILLGYRVLYSIHTRRSERSLAIQKKTKNVASPTIQTVVLKGLENFTEYKIEVLGYTRIGDGKESDFIYVSTDENVPGKPPNNLIGNNASSTSIQVYWDPVPRGFVYGILRGYRIMYKVSALNTSYVSKTLSRGSKNVLLSGLLKYTYYDIKILAFTRIGDGVQSHNIRVQTDEDTPSKAPVNVQPSNKVSSTAIPITWKHIPQQYVHGRLRGYHIKYQLVKLSDNEIDDQVYSSVKVYNYDTNVTLQGLKSYATYKIQIAGFTIKGDGVWATVWGTTCRCHNDLPLNWFDHPPYVKDDDASFAANESTFNNITADVKGIFPPILLAAVKFCCGECAVESPLDLRKKGFKKEGLIQVKESINNDTFFNFPIGGIKGQTMYQGHQGIYEFVSIMDMPGAAFLVADRRNIHTEVLFTILGCWPTVVFVVVVAYLAGILIWIIDVRFNPDHFPNSFIAGSWEGFWWSYITMTTVGYGDRIPKSVLARLFTVVWIWIGIATIATLTSSITASLMSMVFETKLKLYGTKVAAINSSSEYKLGVRRNADLHVGRIYSNITEIYQDLEAERVHAALLDSYATASQKDLFDKKWLRVRDIIKTGFDSTYGAVLSGDSMKLGRCMRDYMVDKRSEISRIVQDNVESITASKIPPAVKRSSDLLTAESELFKTTATILGSMLAGLVALSLLYEYCRRRKIKKKQKQNNNEKDVEGSWPSWVKLPAKQRYDMTIDQYRQDLDNFYKSFREAYEMLKKKHSLQIKNFNQCKVGLHHFSVGEWTGGRSATYAVTQEDDVNSILDGLDMSMFDGKDSDKKTKLGL